MLKGAVPVNSRAHACRSLEMSQLEFLKFLFLPDGVR